MGYGLTGGVDQIVEVFTLLADGAEDMVFTLYRMKLAFENYQFQLIDELSTFQRMQLLQFSSKTSPRAFRHYQQ